MKKAYLCSMYSTGSPTPEVLEQRFEAACRAAKRLMDRGYAVFSPIAHGHPINRFADTKEGHNFWMEQDLHWLECADVVFVLISPGWEDSKGVRQELRLAEELGLDVKPIVDV